MSNSTEQSQIEDTAKDEYSRKLNGEKLRAGAQNGNLSEVKAVIEAGNVDIDPTDQSTGTALHIASIHGHLEIVKYLISLGANVNTQLEYPGLGFYFLSPLVSAVSRGHVEIAKVLIENGAKTDCAKDGKNLLDAALRTDNPDMISLLLGLGFDIDQSNGRGRTPLSLAMGSHRIKSVEFLLEHGVDSRKACADGYLPLYYGIDKGYEALECVKLLIKHVAAKWGEAGTAEYVNNNDNVSGRTALHIACLYKSYDMVKLLLKHGADPDIQCKEGNKPCFYVGFGSSEKNERIASLLLEKRLHCSRTREKTMFD